jgi:hypothetical protein
MEELDIVYGTLIRYHIFFYEVYYLVSQEKYAEEYSRRMCSNVCDNVVHV